jgi:ribokinase
MRIAVIGSINMDLVTRVDHFPQPGETLRSEETGYFPGGKGANQALAAHRAGADVAMVGAVGADSFAMVLRSTLQNEGIDISGVAIRGTTSGLAFITIDPVGQNTIIINPGANQLLTNSDVTAARMVIEGASWLLLQNEIPWSVNESAIMLAQELGIPVILNPAPAFIIPEEIYPLLALLVLNETEATAITGIAVSTPAHALSAAHNLIARGANEVLITLGVQGAIHLCRSGEIFMLPAFPVNAVDTTAAGDTFIGAYAVSRLSDDHAAALRFASAAAALCVTRPGAQVSIPKREEILDFLAHSPASDFADI